MFIKNLLDITEVIGFPFRIDSSKRIFNSIQLYLCFSILTLSSLQKISYLTKYYFHSTNRRIYEKLHVFSMSSIAGTSVLFCLFYIYFLKRVLLVSTLIYGKHFEHITFCSLNLFYYLNHFFFFLLKDLKVN